MSEVKILKKITPVLCPHCNKSIFVSFQMMIPNISGIATQEELDNAKKTLRDKVKEIKFVDPKELEGILNWVDDEETMLTNDDVDEVVRNIYVDQQRKEQEQRSN